MKKIFSYILLFMIVFLPFACERSETGPVNVDEEIVVEMSRIGIPSVVACIMDRDGIRWTGTYGYANREYSIPVTEETIYPLQSISKVILSVIVFQLWERGLINLEADINDYLPFDVRNPNYPEVKITPYMLLNHSSSLAWPEEIDGIPDFHHFYTIEEEPPLLIDWIPEYILPDGASYRTSVWKLYAPGTVYQYSNIGTSLLALIVEQISGMDYRDYCRENIFDPLEMNSSTFYLSELDYAFIVTPYYNLRNPMYYFTCRHFAAGFLNTNLQDFAKFVQACIKWGELNGKRILKEDSFRKMLEVQNPQSGVSWLWDHYIGGTVGHIGGGTGFATCFEWDPEKGTAFFIFSNIVNKSVYHHGRIYELVKYKSLNI